MAAAHKLQVTFDEATGEVRITHRCTVVVGGHTVSHAVEVAPDDRDALAAALKGWIDANREQMEKDAGLLAVRHVAAVTGKDEPGVKRIAVGGSLGPAGGSAVKKD